MQFLQKTVSYYFSNAPRITYVLKSYEINLYELLIKINVLKINCTLQKQMKF